MVAQAQSQLLDLVERVPAAWEPEIFAANTPFTAYLRLREAIAQVRSRIHYFDRYLGPEFFDLFLADLDRQIQIRLVTTKLGVERVLAVSRLARAEFSDYQLVQATPGDFHDRNLIVDDRVFSLGPGAERAGAQLTNFGPADSSPAAHSALTSVLQAGTPVHV